MAAAPRTTAAVANMLMREEKGEGKPGCAGTPGASGLRGSDDEGEKLRGGCEVVTQNKAPFYSWIAAM
jgi:hypothetical protein